MLQNMKFPDNDFENKIFHNEYLNVQPKLEHNGSKYQFDISNDTPFESKAMYRIPKIHTKSTPDEDEQQFDLNENEAVITSKNNNHENLIKQEVNENSLKEEVKYPFDLKINKQYKLKKEFKSIHKSTKYPCNLCDHKAANQSNLKKHKRSIHDGIKYPCNQCDSKFNHQSSLHAHKMSKHERVK